ncbi:type VII secretion integral membrane protein EccD [Mycobacterium sp. CVI_P3]|uniref:Type VII secretion integral membrane protein EccD n=1 Tax=Mycobacterium pinniadriaticum TaxID=2994102 RepID=A0ABT3SJY1_9MYCO|nr:type VII secretion integral membrane protein EccD [Mycobacterium pinniadriaticum]MCX2933417.1 type VII secretion integral membrane protein EccD [Mycobacterium pinniadriaticum]MCX2939839.1 type VII secretion integral membrane protein EccD [Mycobacterium pinniadriaticum]
MTDVSVPTDSGPVLPIVRVAILADGRLVDVALPAALPMREILPAVRRLLPPGKATTDAAPRSLSLAPVGGAPFSLDASLDTVGVVDGDLLALQPVPSGPSAPGVVEDIADAAAIFSASRLRPWGIANVAMLSRIATIVLILAATAMAVAHRIAVGGVAGLYAVSAVAAVAVFTALLARAGEDRWAAELSIVALVPIGAGLASAVDGGPGPAQVMLTAAGVTAWSLICVMVVERCLAFFAATTVIGAAIMIAAAVAQGWELPLSTLGCGLLAVALLLAVNAAQLSALTARLPLPVIPAPGDPAPSAPAMRVLEDLPRRVRLSEAHQTGFIAGAVVLSVLGSLAVVERPDSVGAWGWYAVIATSAAAVLRARVWDTAACKALLLMQPVLASIGLLVLFLSTGHQLPAACVLAALGVFTAALVTASVNPNLAEPESYSLPIRRLVGLLAAAVDASLIPVLAYLVGLFGWVLDR